jgi:hypothetical protein
VRWVISTTPTDDSASSTSKALSEGGSPSDKDNTVEQLNITPEKYERHATSILSIILIVVLNFKIVNTFSG